MIGSFLNSKGANSFTEMNAGPAYRNRPMFLSSSPNLPMASSILILILILITTHSV